MKKYILTLLLLCVLLLCTNPAHSENRTFGLGTALGGPDGLNYKYRMGEISALSGLISFSISENNSRFYTHLDYLQHKYYDEAEWEEGRLYYYYGGGIGYNWIELSREDLVFLRLPSGLGFDFTNVPVDVYFELAPTFNITPEFRFAFNGNFGFRFYLN